jgi:hypothetical protein
MTDLKPISRKILMKKLKILWFEWPFIWWKHEVFKKWSIKIPIPNIHSWKEISKPIISRICKEIWIPSSDFMDLGR